MVAIATTSKESLLLNFCSFFFKNWGKVVEEIEYKPYEVRDITSEPSLRDNGG